MGRREIVALRADRGVHLDENGRVSKWENQAMAFRIKPEDVPEELAGLRGRAEMIATILNEAIEAGLVSPPVWAVIVDEKSPEFKCHEEPVNPAHLATTRGGAEFRISEDGYDKKTTRVEHWKGQTS